MGLSLREGATQGTNDMQYEKRSDIPVPEIAYLVNPRPTIYGLRLLAVNESIAVPVAKRLALKNAAKTHRRRYPGWAFYIEPYHVAVNGQVRLWRIA